MLKLSWSESEVPLAAPTAWNLRRTRGDSSLLSVLHHLNGDGASEVPDGIAGGAVIGVPLGQDGADRVRDPGCRAVAGKTGLLDSHWPQIAKAGMAPGERLQNGGVRGEAPGGQVSLERGEYGSLEGVRRVGGVAHPGADPANRDAGPLVPARSELGGVGADRNGGGWPTTSELLREQGHQVATQGGGRGPSLAQADGVHGWEGGRPLLRLTGEEHHRGNQSAASHMLSDSIP